MKDQAKKRFFTKGKVILFLVLAAAVLLLFWALDARLLVQRYILETDKLDTPVRLVLITDLHSCRYGENMQELIDAVKEQRPDVLLLGGDIFDDQGDNANTRQFLRSIAGKYPCYYVAGNHEYWAGRDAFADMAAFLESCDIQVLRGDTQAMEIRGQNMYICGADDPEAFDFSTMEHQLEAMKAQTETDVFTLLLSHRPEYFETYARYGFDLALCGHAHGGQWRIPLLVNGVYAPNQGMWPDYAGGLYEEEGTAMIVSRGLARETTQVPRIFNRPELVVIDLK